MTGQEDGTTISQAGVAEDMSRVWLYANWPILASSMRTENASTCV